MDTYTYGGFYKWRSRRIDALMLLLEQSNGKSHLEMDDDWVYHPF